MQSHITISFSFHKLSFVYKYITVLFTHREDPWYTYYLSIEEQQSCKLTPAEGFSIQIYFNNGAFQA